MTHWEQVQQRTDDAWKAYEERQNMKRFQGGEDEMHQQIPGSLSQASVSSDPTRKPRYRFFTSAEQAYLDPVIGPLMREEDEREYKFLPPRFCLL